MPTKGAPLPRPLPGPGAAPEPRCRRGALLCRTVAAPPPAARRALPPHRAPTAAPLPLNGAAPARAAASALPAPDPGRRFRLSAPQRGALTPRSRSSRTERGRPARRPSAAAAAAPLRPGPALGGGEGGGERRPRRTHALVVPPHVAALLVRRQVPVPAHELIEELRGRNHRVPQFEAPRPDRPRRAELTQTKWRRRCSPGPQCTAPGHGGRGGAGGC